VSASLHALQVWFLQAVTERGDSEAPDIVAGTSFDGLSIYAHAYLTRLIDCLSQSFPVLSRTVGDEAFTALAIDYLRALPPSSPNLADLGGAFADHLDATRSNELGESGVFLVELARYERALDEVFDGPGGEGGASLASETLTGLSAEAWARVRLVVSPALRVLRLTFPVDDYWASMHHLGEGATPPPLPSCSPQFVALGRRDYVVRRLVLEAEEHALLQALVSGQSVGEALAARSERLDEEALRRWFARWMTEGLFVGIEPC
jgi:hypothetical protein